MLVGRTPSVWANVAGLSTPACLGVSRPAAGAEFTVCTALCCGGDDGSLQEEEVIYIEEEQEEVLGFVQHSPHLNVTKKVLSPLTRGDQLCNDSCCLFDNMMIFQADNWTALKNVRLIK